VENQGSTFTVQLPLGVPADPPPDASNSAAATTLPTADRDESPAWQWQPGMP
jgi:hypothetical protein